MKHVVQEITYHVLYGVIYLVGLLPISVLYGISYLFYVLMYYVFNYREGVVMQNLTRSFPEMGEQEIGLVSRRFYRSFANHFAEMFKSVSISAGKLVKKVEFVGFQWVEEQIREGKNVVACLGHCGNWEMLNILPYLVNFDVYAVYKPLRNPVFNRIMIRLRSRFRMNLIPSKSVARHILTKDGNPGMYLFIADQCPGKVDEKYRIPFLNQQTAMFSGAEKLARASDSVVIYIHIVQPLKGHYRVSCIPLCTNARQTGETEIIRDYARLLEDNIREEPSGWLWSHKRWKR